jgi:hypothetical protein
MLAARTAAATAGRASAAAAPAARRCCPHRATGLPARRGPPPLKPAAVPAGRAAPAAPPPPPRKTAPPRLARTSFTPLSDADPSSLARPLILLFGWLGCRPRDLDKYAAAWRGLGHDTLAVCPGLGPLLVPALSDASAARTARAATAALAAPGRTNRSVIAHVFSNGGFLSAGALLAAERAGGAAAFNSRHPPLALPARLAGLAFDSCPARLNPDLAARGVAAALLAEPALGVEARRPGLVGALRPALAAALGAPPLAARLAASWGAWEDLGRGLDARVPRLFLYSDADALIPASEVERFAAEVVGGRGRGGGGGGGGGGSHEMHAVRRVVFPGSPHCEHLRTDGAKYVAALRDLRDLAAAVEGGGEWA